MPEIDYNRQAPFINPAKFTGLTAAVIGCGATGSHVAVQLAQSGFGNAAKNQGTLRVFDFDVVEPHNLPNQAFHIEHIDMNKAAATRGLIKSKSGFDIEAFPMAVTDQYVAQCTYVFLLVDKMSTRREIGEELLKSSADTELVIETRMGLTEGRVYAFDPRDPKQYEAWQKTLYGDDDAETSSCGTSLSCGVTANLLAGLAVTRMLQHIDWTRGMHYLESRGYQNIMPAERMLSLFPEIIIM